MATPGIPSRNAAFARLGPLIALFGLFEKKADAYSAGVLGVQQEAPPFRAQAVVDGEFKTIQLSDYKGKWVYLFFYPLNFTFV